MINEIFVVFDLCKLSF